MDWLAANNCLAAQQFGWLIGAHSGAFVVALAIAMLLSARAYRYGLQRSQQSLQRGAVQRALRGVVWVVLVVWAICAQYVGREFFFCYATWLAIGTVAVTAPAFVLLMLTAANKVGRRSVRS
jgi:hypothetical protein